MAARQREISVSEFFTKNRHLLGFDNPQKALLTTVSMCFQAWPTTASLPLMPRRMPATM